MQALMIIGCVLSAGVWTMVGLYKLMHQGRMIEVIQQHDIPFPVAAFWLSVVVELGGAVLMLSQQQIWIAACAWIGFLLVATPIFHGRVWKAGAVDYPQLVHVGKNLSILGGLVLLIALDGTLPTLVGSAFGNGTTAPVASVERAERHDAQ